MVFGPGLTSEKNVSGLLLVFLGGREWTASLVVARFSEPTSRRQRVRSDEGLVQIVFIFAAVSGLLTRAAQRAERARTQGESRGGRAPNSVYNAAMAWRPKSMTTRVR